MLAFLYCKHILAFSIASRAQRMDEEPVGRALGGIARAKSLSKEERKRIARTAALARWSGPVKAATHGSADHPLRIGEIAIPCYVLEDGTRVLSQRGLQTGIGMSTGGGSGGAQRMAQFIGSLAEKGINTKDLTVRIGKPIPFRLPGGGPPAYGYEATILTDICDVVLAARNAGKLHPQQRNFAIQCELLTRGLARVGIISLVDEVTGYQRDRAQDALSKILEAFIAKELQPYVRTFPPAFYQEIFRLRGMDYPKDSVKRPQYFGLLTNDIVYKRLAPGVLEELKRVTPKLGSGRLATKLFQRLTANKGYPKLLEHLGAVVTMMQLSNSWHDFLAKLDRLRPRFEITNPEQGQQLSFDYQLQNDSGKGL
jgi:hypothetical protein